MINEVKGAEEAMLANDATSGSKGQRKNGGEGKYKSSTTAAFSM